MSPTYDRQIVQLALPALGAMLADPFVSLVDTAFVGRLGATPLAALGISIAILTVGFWAFIFLAYGITPLVSHALGEGDAPQASRIIGSGLVAAMVLGTGVAILLVFAATPLTDLMGARGVVQEQAIGYLRIRALAMPAVLVILLGHGAFRGHHNTRTPLLVTVVFNLANLILDPLLIFGVRWGLNGAAAATVLAQGLGAFWFVQLIRRRLGVQVAGVSWAETRALLRVGRDVVVRAGAIVIVFTAAARVAAAIGNAQIAAHQVAVQILVLLGHVADAVAVAAQALVARFIGSRRGEDVRGVSLRLFWIGLMLGVAFFLILLAGRSFVPGWFSDDPAVLQALDEIWLILAVIQPLTMPIYVWEGIVMGASDFGYLARLLALSMVFSLVVLVLVGPLKWGLLGVWLGIVTMNTTRGLGLVWWGIRPNPWFRTQSESAEPSS